MKRGGRLSPSSMARLAELPTRRAVREAVFARDGGCLAVGVSGMGQCYGILTPHHILKASAGGKYTEDNLIALCAGHNDLLEADADVAAIGKEQGWVVSGHQKIRGCA